MGKLGKIGGPTPQLTSLGKWDRGTSGEEKNDTAQGTQKKESASFHTSDTGNQAPRLLSLGKWEAPQVKPVSQTGLEQSAAPTTRTTVPPRAWQQQGRAETERNRFLKEIGAEAATLPIPTPDANNINYRQVTRNLDQARRDVDTYASKRKFDIYFGTEKEDTERTRQEEAARARVKQLEAAQAQLAGQIYRSREQEVTQRLAQDQSATAIYQEAKNLKYGRDAAEHLVSLLREGLGREQWEALAKQVNEMYGLSIGADGNRVKDINTLEKLLRDDRNHETNLAKDLAQRGYDYNRLREYDKRQTAAQWADKAREQYAQMANEHPVLSSALTLAAAPAQGVDYLNLLFGNMGRNDPGNLNTYRPLTSDEMTITNFVSTVRQTVGQGIRDGMENKLIGNVLGFVYDTGMSIGDSAIQVATMGPAATVFMGASAASNEAKSVLDQGGSNRQAFLAGAAAGAAEALFEKISIDNLLSKKSVTGWRSWLKETAKQAGVEASEEAFTEIANIISNAAIMGDKSEFATNVRLYQSALGMSEEQAKRAAFLDCVGQVALSAAGGALSGGVMGGVTNAFQWRGSGSTKGAQTANGMEVEAVQPQGNPTALEQGEGVAQAVMDAQEGQNKTASIEETVNENGLVALPKRERENLSSGVRNKIVSTFQDAVHFVRNALGNKQNVDKAYLGKVSDTVAQQVMDAAGMDIRGYNAILHSDNVRHIIKHHGNEKAEAARGQRAVTENDIAMIPQILASPDRVYQSTRNDAYGRPALLFEKEMGGNYVTVQAVTDGTNSITTDTLYIQQKKNSQGTGYNAGQVADPTLNARSVLPQSSSENNIAQSNGEVNVQTTQPGFHDMRSPTPLASPINQSDARQLDAMGKALGLPIYVVDATTDKNGWYQNGEIFIAENTNSPMMDVAKHEITHHLKQAAAEAYQQYVDQVERLMGADFERQVELVQAAYAQHGQQLDREGAVDELAAEFAKNLVTDESLFQRLARENVGLARRIYEALRSFLQRVRDRLTRKQASDLERVANSWEAALTQGAKNSRDGQVMEPDGAARYSINPGFADAIDRWDGKADIYFHLGTTSEAMQSIGVDDRNIVMRSAKAAEILNKHKGMTKDIMKQVPEVLEHPVMVLNSRSASPDNNNQSSRILLFGEVYDTNGAPVTAVLELRPTLSGGEIQDYNLLVSTYGKDKNLHQMVEESEVLYLDKDKNRTDTWLHGLGLQLPSYETKYGSIGNISYGDGFVKIKGTPWQELTGTKTEADATITGNQLPGARRRVTPTLEQSITDGGGAAKGGTPGSGEGQASLRGTEDLGRQIYELTQQNKRLEERNRQLQTQMRRSDGAGTDQAAVKRTAKNLLKEYSSTADVEQVGGQIQRLYDSMANPSREGSLSEREMRQTARDVAEDIISQTSILNDEMYQEYKDLRDHLRTTKINVPQELWGELEVKGGYNQFRKENMGRLNLSSKEGAAIEQVYQELAYNYPGLFNEYEVSHPADQLMQMAQALDTLRPTTENPYAGDPGAVEWLAGEIMERFYDLPQQKPTFADRAKRRQDRAVERERQAGQERMRRALERQGEKIKQLERENEKRMELQARKWERLETNQKRTAIRRHAEVLSRKLLRPTDKQHIPERFRGSVLALLDVIDLESKYGYLPKGDGTFQRVNQTEAQEMGIQLEPTKRTHAARDLKAAYDALRTDPEFTGAVDPDLADKLEAVAEMGQVRLADMDKGRLAIVEYILGKEIFAEYNTIVDITISTRLPMCSEEVSVI